tara:strand:- start:1391 stop:1594 length:204 start_codon:yes stop_codon:yes gene_type:complete
MIQFSVNDQILSLEKAIDLNSLLEHIQSNKNGIAIAVNQNIIAKDDWPKTQIKNDDQILIIKATQGG